ncbi:hypothetical protein BDP55DRAFT_106551 [Colletotrichum godetiae]|uniref:Uncharacterized protein n=1 Tax=Colletotrichum godetiae TaxID=1209918 RepID=A0AAJ0AME9_9PEZI|nr:uncharacterized protein BDP55DRAFT_106551 [Colletotrichum godetiae]KAK1676572.1 hypothetical protein BDP55DRAFT_106551 [Colletotrichum godetiae]
MGLAAVSTRDRRNSRGVPSMMIDLGRAMYWTVGHKPLGISPEKAYLSRLECSRMYPCYPATQRCALRFVTNRLLFSTCLPSISLDCTICLTLRALPRFSKWTSEDSTTIQDRDRTARPTYRVAYDGSSSSATTPQRNKLPARFCWLPRPWAGCFAACLAQHA